MGTLGARFAAIRQATVFLLGVAVMVDALLGDSDTLTELIIGAIMVGVLPIENVINWVRLGAARKLPIDPVVINNVPSQTTQKAPSAPGQEAPLSD